ncbi:MAG: esterase family protein [Clostridia bacterium]|nr:esterase family protein [Clostridia bacterium]
MKLMRAMALMLVIMLLVFCAFSEEDPFKPASQYDTPKSGVAYPTAEEKTYYSTTCEKDRKCMVYLPAGYTAEKEYPVLYLFHGIGGDHKEWKDGKPDIVVGNLVNAGEAPEMIIVTPNCKAVHVSQTAGGMYSAGAIASFDNFINEMTADLMPFINSTYSVKEGRENTAIAGLSMGGRVALHLGISMPETFGYVGAFCPAPGVIGNAVGQALFTKEAFKGNEEYPQLILINTGLSDNTVGEWPETYYNALVENGTDAIFYKCVGGHDFFVWKNGLYNFAKRIFDEAAPEISLAEGGV